MPKQAWRSERETVETRTPASSRGMDRCEGSAAADGCACGRSEQFSPALVRFTARAAVGGEAEPASMAVPLRAREDRVWAKDFSFGVGVDV